MSIIRKLRQVIKSGADEHQQKPKKQQKEKIAPQLTTVDDFEKHIEAEIRKADRIVDNFDNHGGKRYINPAKAQVAMINLMASINQIPTQADKSIEEMQKLRDRSMKEFEKLEKTFRRYNHIPIYSQQNHEQN